jgi:hypothetical protein
MFYKLIDFLLIIELISVWLRLFEEGSGYEIGKFNIYLNPYGYPY